MQYKDLIAASRRFGAAGEDVCLHTLGVPGDSIHENVIISPGWDPDRLSGLGKATPAGSGLCSIQVWEIGESITYIKAGFGAPVVLDALLPLGVTGCKRILFVSSVGALDPAMHIGDIVVPEYSVCGDGASRYITSENLGRDVFGEKAYPDPALHELLKAETQRVCRENQVGWHVGKTFCTDTIFAQFPHIDSIVKLGCNSIDLETAAAFRAARLMEIPLAALFNVSDNTASGQSLMTATPQDARVQEHRRFVRGELMPQMILRFIKACKNM